MNTEQFAKGLRIKNKNEKLKTKLILNVTLES